MDRNLQQAVDARDLPRLAQGLAHVPSLVPDPSWNAGAAGWATLAEAGATAAKNGDLAAAQKACKSCHRTWRNKYKASFRMRPVR
jgi:hypothetical protein